MPLKGSTAHVLRLRRLTDETVPPVSKALFRGAQLIQVEAQISISTGSVSGAGHKPSRPGTPPSGDTGVLANNIETVQKEPLVSEVSSNAPYAAIHEFGGTIKHPGGTPYFMRDGKPVFVSNKGAGAYHNLPKTKPHDIIMPERSYMRPARDKKRKEVVKLVQRAVSEAVRRSRSTAKD